RHIVLVERGRAAASRNSRRKRLQAGAELGIGDLAKPFAKLLRHRPKLRALRPGRSRRRPALPEHDPINRGITEEQIDLVDDHRGQMLHQRRMRALDQQGKDSAAFPSGGKADRFGAPHLRVALADDFGPASDDRALDEAEAAERLVADRADEIARRTRPAAPRGLLFFQLFLRHGASACHSQMVTANAASRLVQHYVDKCRRLAWRSPPGAPPPDPYIVWLSEVMLQQTTVAAVTPRFERFVERWPTLDALAAARDEDILSEWAGLGYYARARNVIACARAVAERGGFPRTAAELRELPGIGA